MASGFPDSVPAWYTGPSGASSAIRSRRPPKAPTGSPPPITLPKHHRSGVTPDQPVAPAGPRRKPVITSSKISSAPAASQAARSPSRNPGAGATRFMLAATGSTMTQATRSSRAGHHVVGDDLGVGHRAGRDADRARQAEHGHAAAPAGQQAVGVAVVAAVELDHPVAAGRAAGQAHRAHGRLGARGDQPHLLAAGHPFADGLGQQDLARGRRAERRAARRGRVATASVTAGCAWPSRTAP